MFTNLNVFQPLPALLNQWNMVLKISASINVRYSSNRKNTLLWNRKALFILRRDDGFWQNDTCGTQKVRITLCTDITVTRGVHMEHAVYRLHTLNPAVPTSDTTRHTYATTAHGRQKMPSKVITMQDVLYLQTRVYCFRAILSPSSKPHSDNQLPHTRYRCSSGTSSNQLITLKFADDTAIF
jgi:hypothetical protein